MACIDCKDDCRQGRDCPHRTTIDFGKIWKWIIETITKK
jgi:hypothetical protein